MQTSSLWSQCQYNAEKEAVRTQPGMQGDHSLPHHRKSPLNWIDAVSAQEAVTSIISFQQDQQVLLEYEIMIQMVVLLIILT